MKKSVKAIAIFFCVFSFFSCATNVAKNSEEKGEKKLKVSTNIWKNTYEANPILPNVFCADPTAVEFEGRLYVYGTNDHQQYFNAEKNTYEHIKTLVCFSTDDMANWTYHGEINVRKIAPWIYNSWAPSICKRVESDGLTHFYLYFSNSGNGVGVITATNPLGPWKDPLKKPLIRAGMEGLNSPAPFDPGVCIDDKGIGWLAFGGGVSEGHEKSMPGSSKLIQLGEDMISIASDFVDLKAPYFFEASEMNFVNGIYVYTFNTNWDERSNWPIEGVEKATTCSMAYMTTKTPLISDSWEYKGHYFKNPGEMGLNFSNNHTHYEKYNGEWYLIYHTLTLQEKSPTKGGFRSICVDKLEMDEENVKISLTPGTRRGVDKIKNLNPFETVAGTTVFTNADTWYEEINNPSEIATKSVKDGAWIMLKNVDFAQGASQITAQLKGKGYVEIRLDRVSSKPSATLKVKNSEEYASVTSKFEEEITGVHDVFIVFSAESICLQKWKVE